MRLFDPHLRRYPRSGFRQAAGQRARLEAARQLVAERRTQSVEVGFGAERPVGDHGIERVERFRERKRLLLGDEGAEAACKADQSVDAGGLGHSLIPLSSSCITIISP